MCIEKVKDGYKQELLDWIENHKVSYQEIAKYIWENPELSLEEYKASAKLTDVLAQNDFRIERNIAGLETAFIATYGDEGPCIGFNAEYDCLPGLSQKAGSSKKEPLVEGGLGQGCGHNLLGTAAVYAAIAVSNILKKYNIKAILKVFGSPAEELCIGKPFMGRAGCYNNVDAFLDWHPWNYNRADYDTCSAYFSIKYHFKGKTAHGNSPWHGRSAFDAAMLMGHAVELLREHYEPAASDKANTINYTFTETGPAFPSVVPDTTTAWYIGRFTNTKLMEDVIRRVDLCANAGAMATETMVTKELITATHEKVPNIILSKVMHDNFTALGTVKFTKQEQELVEKMQIEEGLETNGLDESLKEFGTSGTALCDTSEFSWNAPYATFWMTMAPDGGWHNWRVTSCAGSSIGMKTMVHAAKLLSLSCLDICLSPEILQQAQLEWKERMNHRVYQSLVPAEISPPVGNQNK
ncbi:MAG: amidohydrolase [Lachnotalea sp.]